MIVWRQDGALEKEEFTVIRARIVWSTQQTKEFEHLQNWGYILLLILEDCILVGFDNDHNYNDNTDDDDDDDDDDYDPDYVNNNIALLDEDN